VYGAQLGGMIPIVNKSKTWIPCGGHVLEQNGEWEIENYWLLYEEVRGEHEICMDSKSSNIGYPPLVSRVDCWYPLSVTE
jgi:hypothetical protein